MVNQGKMLDHIISREGLAIDPYKVKSIKALPLASNKKALQSFFFQINFVKFISDLSKIVSPIITMLKKDAQFSWLDKEKKAFHNIKITITEALVLKNLDFSKDFIMYVYGDEKSIATILAHKDD